MRRIWFTSDQHFSHFNVIKYCGRPYLTIEEMNADLIHRHNEVVGKDDLVMHLGDFSLWKGAPAAFLHQLNGEHHLIAGNHDWCHPVQAKTDEKIGKFRKLYEQAGFRSIALQGIAELVPGLTVKLHHMPYLTGQEPEDVRYRELRPADDGSWLLHGHVHEKWRVRNRMFNVGVDVNHYRPVSLEEIVITIKAAEKI